MQCQGLQSQECLILSLHFSADSFSELDSMLDLIEEEEGMRFQMAADEVCVELNLEGSTVGLACNKQQNNRCSLPEAPFMQSLIISISTPPCASYQILDDVVPLAIDNRGALDCYMYSIAASSMAREGHILVGLWLVRRHLDKTVGFQPGLMSFVGVPSRSPPKCGRSRSNSFQVDLLRWMHRINV